MIFYLGTHETSWLTRTDVPLMVSHHRLRGRLGARCRLPRALGPWVLDSGAFSEIQAHGRWTSGPEEYVEAVRRYRDEIGGLVWAAPQDWMCEPFMLDKTGLSLEVHQKLTTENYLELVALAPDLPWIPVLQGWHPADYFAHCALYEDHGVDLAAHDTVGLGSVCRRQATAEISLLVRELAATGLRLHGFGAKLGAFVSDVPLHLASADSLAWSYNARRNPPLAGCTHKNCNSCLRWALNWREKVLRLLDQPKQPAMAFGLGSPLRMVEADG